MVCVHESSHHLRSVQSRGSGRVAALIMAMVVATVGTLTACSTEPPERDSALVDVNKQLIALEDTPVGDASPVFGEQAAAIDEEILRQCGTDSDGETPESCTTHDDVGFEGEPQIAAVREDMMSLIGESGDADYPGAPDDEGARERAVLLTGLHAALATFSARSSGGAAVDQELLDDGFSDSEDTADALSTVTELVHQAVYLSGVVLPSSGENRGVISTVGTRLRSIRDAVEPITGVAAEPGYSTDIDTSDPTAAAKGLLEAVHAVTVELRRAVDSVAAEDREVTAMWCAVAARSEASLEDMLGSDPSSVSIRGE